MERKERRSIIEEWFPIEYVGEQGRLEKTSPGGRIQSIHQWHARRPTSAIRAIILSSLLDKGESPGEFDLTKQLIEQYATRFIPAAFIYPKTYLGPREGSLSAVLSNVLDSQLPPSVKVLDPFAGGGSIPHELSYLGLDTYGTDLNPVAVLINKATTEFPIKYKNHLLDTLSPLIKKYAKIIEDGLSEKIGHLYKDLSSKASQIIYFVWVREIPCTNLKCRLRIPLFKSLILDESKKVGLIVKDYVADQITFGIGWGSNMNGFYKKGAIVCPKCDTVMKKEIVHEYSQNNIVTDRLIALYEIDQEGNRSYRIALKSDEDLFKETKAISTTVMPDLEFPERVLLWRVLVYGVRTVRQMFNDRQYLLACTLCDLMLAIYPSIVKDNGEELAKAIITYLQFGLAKILDFNSKFCMIKLGTRIRSTWTRPGLFMSGMYVESNPLYREISGGWMKYFDDLERAFKTISDHPVRKPVKNPIFKQMDAQKSEFKDDFFDYIITDPPYYDSVPYAADSDYFYVWEKTVLGNIFPDLFIGSTTPKEQELIADSNLRGSAKNAKAFYEAGMAKAFSEMYRVLKPSGLCVVVFANKSMDAWETLLQAFIKSRFVITATWPVPMESKGKITTMTSASLTSVVLVIARKIAKEPEVYLDKKAQAAIAEDVELNLSTFWKEGIRGADFFMCAIGPALTHYCKHERILDPSTDEVVNISSYLQFVQGLMVDFAVKQITATFAARTIDKITQFYLVWRWGYGLNLLPFDEVKKLYQALTIDMADIEGKILERQKKKADYACLSPSQRFKDLPPAKLKTLKMENIIDHIQFACYLWEKGEHELLEERISEAVTKHSDAIWTIAQALYDILPDCQEATQLQGLLQRYKHFKPSEKAKPTKEETTTKKTFDAAYREELGKSEKVTKKTEEETEDWEEGDELDEE